MSAGFETLIYTDCRPGEGLDGTAGFQFQARSPGADQRARSIMQRCLLYQAPINWMAERRPVTAYPPSLAHIHDGYFLTAAGVYLGKEANGGREGNQLTHGIVTDDPDVYGPVRPAQLYGAPFWTTSPHPSTQCPPLGEDWEPGPFTTAQAQELVLAAPGGRDLLTTLVTTLWRGGEERRRVLFIAEDPALVLRWVAAGTLLLPQRKALSVGFRVFSTTPTSDPQQIVAVHPQWNTLDAGVHNDHGFVVIDLMRHEWSAVEPGALARLWVDLFCAEDPYDTVDAVEVAAASRQPELEAPAVALAAVLGRRPSRQQAASVVSWLESGPDDQLEFYGGAVTDLLLQDISDLPKAALLRLDELARRDRSRGQRAALWPVSRIAAVRLALFQAECDLAATRLAVLPGVLPPWDDEVWGEPEQAAQADLLAAALSGATPPVFEALLRLAARFAVRVPLERVRDAVNAFVTDWAAHPQRSYDVTSWSSGDEVWYLLLDELQRRVALGPQAASQVGDDWWPALITRAWEVGGGLRDAVISAAMLGLTTERRRRLVRDCLTRAAERPGEVTPERMIEVLFGRRPADVAELAIVAEAVPPGTLIAPEVFAELNTRLHGRPEISRDTIALAETLARQDLFHPGREVAIVLQAVRAMPRLLRALAAAKPAEGLAAELARIPPAVRRLYSPQMVASLLENIHPPAAFRSLAAMPELWQEYCAALRDAIRGRDGDPAQAVAALLIGSNSSWAPTLTPEMRGKLFVMAQSWIRRAGDQELAEADALVERLKSKEIRALWDLQLESARGKGRRWPWRRSS